MFIEVIAAKIHRAIVTDANRDYVGSVTLSGELMDAVGIREGQKVIINNCSNGVSWFTYAVRGGKGALCLNGPPARHFLPGDIVIVLAYGYINSQENVPPFKVVFVDEHNNIKNIETKNPQQ